MFDAASNKCTVYRDSKNIKCVRDFIVSYSRQYREATIFLLVLKKMLHGLRN